MFLRKEIEKPREIRHSIHHELSLNLTNDKIILKTKQQFSSAKELETSSQTNFLYKSQRQNPLKFIEFLKKIFGKYMFFDKKLDFRCFFSKFKHFSSNFSFIRFFLDFLAFFMFFVYLKLQRDFMFSFFMIFELFFALAIIIGLILRITKKNIAIFSYLFTFLIPLIGFLLPNNEKINIYLNFIRVFRFVKIVNFVKKLMRKQAFFFMNFLEFLIIGIGFLMTKEFLGNSKEFYEGKEINLAEMFIKYEIMMFDCMNLINCEEIEENTLKYHAILVSFIAVYYCVILTKILYLFGENHEKSLNYEEKSRKYEEKHKKYEEKPNFRWNSYKNPLNFFKKRKTISIFGEIPLKFLSELLFSLDSIDKGHFLYKIQFFLDKNSWEKSRKKLEVFLKENSFVKTMSFFINFSMNLSWNLIDEKTVKNSDFIYVFLKKNDVFYMNSFYLNMINRLKTHENPTFMQKIVIFFEKTPSNFSISNEKTMGNSIEKTIGNYDKKPRNCDKKRVNSKEKTSVFLVISSEKFEKFLISQAILNPIFSSFLSSFSQKTHKNHKNMLKNVKIPFFFHKKSFAECSKILYFSSFYCIEYDKKGENTDKLMIILGILKKNQEKILNFMINPLNYTIKPQDSMLILTNNDKITEFLDKFNEFTYKKYQEIVDLMENSFENGEIVNFRHKIEKNLNLSKNSFEKNTEKNWGFFDLFQEKPLKIPFQDHFIIISTNFTRKNSGFLCEITEILHKNDPKIMMVFFFDRNKAEIDEFIRNFQKKEEFFARKAVFFKGSFLL